MSNNDNNNQVYLQKAIDWTKLWRETCPNNCKAFSIPVSDLVNVLKEIGVIKEAGNTGLYTVNSDNNPNGVRAYMAIDPDLIKQPGGGEKLLLLGTKAVWDSRTEKIVQRDIINGKLDNKGNPIHPLDTGHGNLGDPEPNTGIYDFTIPCPDFCDPQSPLITGKE